MQSHPGCDIVGIEKFNFERRECTVYNTMLRGRIVQKYGSMKNIAKPMGLSYVTIIHKIKGYRDWTASEIEKLCRLLEIKAEDIPLYFFTDEV